MENKIAKNNIRLGIFVIVIVSDSMVRVDMILEQKTQKFIKSDAIAVIGSEGLMGNKVLNITAGSFGKKMIADNGYVLTKQLVSMDDIMVKMHSRKYACRKWCIR